MQILLWFTFSGKYVPSSGKFYMFVDMYSMKM